MVIRLLGGIYERSKDHSVRKVPFFGDLPGVGVLFKRDFKQDNNRELLFFITPKILLNYLINGATPRFFMPMFS